MRERRGGEQDPDSVARRQRQVCIRDGRIMRLAPEHRADWEKLFAGYAEFYKVAQTPEMREQVWGWLHDPDHESEAIVAVDGAGRAIGLAHYLSLIHIPEPPRPY